MEPGTFSGNHGWNVHDATAYTSAEGVNPAEAVDRATASTKPSARELMLRNDTRKILSRATVPNLGFQPEWYNDTTTGGTSATSTTRDLSSLLHSGTGVFLGVWRRTEYSEGEWPLCMSGSNPGACGLEPFDASHGIVWRFVNAMHGDKDQADELALARSYPNGQQKKTFLARLECIDHKKSSTEFRRRSEGTHDEPQRSVRFSQEVSPNPSSHHNKLGFHTSRAFLSQNLQLVSSPQAAAVWRVETYPAFRNGPEDVAIMISLDSATLMGEPGAFAYGLADSNELVLCSHAEEKTLVLVKRSRLNTADAITGKYMYNVAWECTPDADAPLKAISQSDEMPLDRYIDDPLFSVLKNDGRK